MNLYPTSFCPTNMTVVYLFTYSYEIPNCVNLCINFTGAPASTVGWRDPGFIHTGFLKELWPNLKYVLNSILSYFVITLFSVRRCDAVSAN